MKNHISFFILAVGMTGCSGYNATTTTPQYDAGYIGCTNDLDCVMPDGSDSCGTDVCSWANPSVHICVPATSNDPGWCGDDPYLLANGGFLPQTVANTTCKCYKQGATCNIITNFCSFTYIK